MSELAKKDDVFNLGGTLQETSKKIQELGKAQSDFMADTLSKGMNFQKEQYDLVSRIVQNQIEHNSVLLQSYMNVVNNNIKSLEPKEQKK